MQKRKRELGNNVIKLIGDSSLVEVLRPYYATTILKTILNYHRIGEEITMSRIAKDLNIYPSTVKRNIERFNLDHYLITTEQKGNSYIVNLTEKGLKIARIIENSEAIEIFEKNRNETTDLIKANSELSKDLKAIIRVREMSLRELKEKKATIDKEIRLLKKKNDFEAKMRIKELQRRLLTIEEETHNTEKYVKEKKGFITQIKKESRSLQRKLDDFPGIKKVIE